MAIDFLYPLYEVVRNPQRCICCRACERQCANEVHHYDVDFGCMISDEKNPEPTKRSGKQHISNLYGSLYRREEAANAD